MLYSSICFSQSVTLDDSFGNSGKVEANFGDTFVLKDVKTSPDNSIYVLGQITDNSVIKTLLIKYTTSGNLDETFGDNGIVETTFSPLNNFIPSVLNLIDANIYIAGTFLNAPNTYFSRELMIMRLNNSGAIDTSFGENGFLQLNLNPNPSLYRYWYGENIFSFSTFQNNDMLLQINCSGVVIGQSSSGKAVFVRLNGNGEMVSTFGENGVKEIATPSSTFIYDNAILSNDNFVVLGVSGGYGMFNLYNNSGSFMNNHTFQTQGLYSFLNVDSNESSLFAIGNTIFTNYILKFNYSLQQDLNFGANGILNVPQVGKIKVAPNRLFNVVGSVNNNHLFNVYDYSQNGVSNLDFGDNGLFTFSFGNNAHVVKSLFNVEDDKLLVVGTHGENLVLSRIVFETLGVEDFNQSIRIKVYPNPTQDILYIDSESNIESVAIYSSTGQMIQEYDVDNNNIQLSLENFSTGIYFVKISSNGQTKTIKVSKN
jgi:hypothetical protein